MFNAIADGFSYLWGALAGIGKFILDGIFTLLQPLIDLITAVFYFVYMLGVVIVKVVTLVLSVAKLLLGLIAGLFNTITGLNYTPSASAIPNVYNSTFAQLEQVFSLLQLDKIAYITLFGIWVFTGIAAVKIIGNMGANND